jgi:redox-sensing transcriptional repressor
MSEHASNNHVPRAVVGRLSLYLRALLNLSVDRVATVSSARFGKLVGVKPAQLRKDLAHFGQFGVRGKGYEVDKLARRIESILGTEHEQKVALVGVGNLGRALFSYKGFESRRFKIAAVFDSKLAGQRVPGSPLSIRPVGDLRRTAQRERIRLGIIAVPAAAAQAVAREMGKAGIRGILNFAPVRLSLPDGVRVENIDLSSGLESLSFGLRSRRRRG